jgi:hypothetical protein
MNAIAMPAGSSHIRRDGDEVGVGDEGGDGVGVGDGGRDGGRDRGRDGGTDFCRGPGRAGVVRCQVLTSGIRLLVSSVGDPQATPSSGTRHGCRDAYAASAHAPLRSRLAVPGSDGIMLLSGVPARAPPVRHVRRRLATRGCRHKVALPSESRSPVVELVGRRPRRGHMHLPRAGTSAAVTTLVHLPKSTSPRPQAK